MNRHGLFSSVAGVGESPGKCEQCGATTRLGEGVCLRCLLEEGLEVEGEPSVKVFKSALREANVPTLNGGSAITKFWSRSVVAAWALFTGHDNATLGASWR